jgi:homoserine kinase type II
MAIYTVLKDQKIAELLAQFPATAGSAQTGLFKAQGIALGTVNTYYKITLKNGAVFFLKIDEVGNRKRLLNELAIFKFLQKNTSKLPFCFPIPELTKQKKSFIPLGKKFVLLFAEVKGKPLFEKKLTTKHLRTIGAALACLHGLTLSGGIKEHRFNLAGQQAVFKQILPRLKRKHPELIVPISERLRWLKDNEPKQARGVLIHADLFAENIHWLGEKLHGILDYEAAGRGHALFDLGVCLHALCHNGKKFDARKAQALLKGYQSARRLSAAERAQFWYYLNQSTLRFLLTRLRDFELAPGEVKAEPFKDYREFVIRFEENKTLRTLLA